METKIPLEFTKLHAGIIDSDYYKNPYFSICSSSNNQKDNPIEIHRIEIKPGMVIVTEINDVTKRNIEFYYIVIPTKIGLALMQFGKKFLIKISDFIAKPDFYGDVIRIHDVTNNQFLTEGKILWKKYEQIELTMDQIADKFGIDVKNLKIKK